MELILAEKPSAARNFAKALGGKTGNYAGTEYKITNLRGHVMGLLPPDKQVPTEKVEFYKSWDLENLPWNLNDFAWKKGILSGCKDIISGLKDELKEADCVVIATDVDPSGEGELLAWEALEKCGWRGTTKRMYFADEAPASVQKAFLIIFERHIQKNVLHRGKRKDAFHDAVKVGFIQCGNLRAEGFNRAAHVAKMMGTLFPCALA